MIICKKCGFEINENSRYCSQCGVLLADADSGAAGPPPGTSLSAPENVRYCGKCGAKLPETCAYCLICGVKAGEAPDPEPEPEPASEQPLPSAPAARRHSRRLAAVCVALGILLALSAGGMWFYQNLPYFGPGGMSRAKDAIIYATADGSLRFKTPSMDAPEEIVPNYSSRAGISGSRLAKVGAGGRYIAYIDGYGPTGGSGASGRLLVRDFARKPSLDSAEPADLLIAENVTDEFFFTDNGSSLVFLTAAGELYSTDFSRNEMLDSEVSQVLGHSDTQIFYAKEAGEGLSLYLCPSANAGGAIAIDIDVISVADHTPTLDRFVYLRAGSGGSRDIMACDVRQGTRRTLAVGVGEVIAADARTFTAMYTTESANPLRYDNLIDDNLARSDERIREPSIEDYPMLSEFYDTYGLDTDYDEEMENYEELAEESAQLQEDMDKYNEKLDRDEFRAQAREDIDYFVEQYPTLYDLHLTTYDGLTTRLAGGSYTPFADAVLDMENGFAVWSARSLGSIKKIPITKHADEFSGITPFEYLSEALSDEICFQQSGYATSPLHIGDGRFRSGGWQLAGKGTGIYFAMGAGPVSEPGENSFSLYYAPIENGLAGRIVLIDENISGVGPMLQDDRLLYYKDSFEDRCALFMTGGGAGERLGDNVSLLDEYFRLENGGKTFLYYEHFDSASKSGNLFMIGKQNRQIATDVHRAFYRSDSLLYFLRGLKNGRAELYSFSDEGLSLVDENVVCVME